MITQLIVNALAALFTAIIGLFPQVPVPGWVSSGQSSIASVVTAAQGFDNWLPVGLMFNVVGVVIAARLVGYSIKGIRILASFLTAGGGSAA